MQKVFAKSALLDVGWAQDVRISFEHGIIKKIEKSTQANSDDLNLGDQILLPSIANVHSHSFQRAMAGLSERRGPSTDSFWTWRDVMYRFLDHLSVEDIHAIAAFTFMEMAEAGYSAVGEFHYVHHQPGGSPYDNPSETSFQIINAATEVGLGLTHLPVLYRFGGVDEGELKGGQRRFGSDIGLFHTMVEGAQHALKEAPSDYNLGVAPHSLRAVNPALLSDVSTMLPDAPIHMHIAEQLAEVGDVEARFGARPVEWLLDNQDVNEHWCLIHCTHMTQQETSNLAQSGAVAGLCPITEANLGDGIFNGQHFVSERGNFGIGSDSDLRISLSEELRTLEHAQRYASNQRTVLAKPNSSNAQFLIERSARGGAQALGRNAGALEIGKLADFMTIQPDRFLADDLPNSLALDYWLFAARDEGVTNLWSAGRHIVKDGQHAKREALTRDFLASIKKLRALL